jgi:eukaryotic-like serine/threonine-protein kinase
MSEQKEVSDDLLVLLSHYAGSWSELLSSVDAANTESIMGAITSESDSALRQALSQIDVQLRHQQANVSNQTAIKHTPDGITEPIPGLASAPVAAEDGDATIIRDSSADPYGQTYVGGADEGGQSGRHTTWPTQKAADGRAIPSAIGNYDIHSVLGRGGMGVVYRAKQRGLNREVALKMILSGPHADVDLLARFRAEAEAVALLQHPNIVQIYDIGEENGLPYFSLEFVDGPTLDEFRDGQPVDERKAAALIETIARAMHFAHDAGIVHRDLKPANVLLTQDGEPKVTDFGLVKRIEGDDIDSQTQTGAIMGTPHYMSPEQAWGKTDIGRGTDVWALGAMLYALLTGRAPFVGANTMDTLVQLRENEPVAPSELVSNVSVDIETICLKCLQKETERRYATAQELADDIHRYLDGIPILARPVGRMERTWRWCRRKPLIAGLTVALAVAMVAGTTFSVAFGIMATDAAEAESIARLDADDKRVYAEQKEQEAKDNAELAEENADLALRQRTVALGAFNTAVEWAGTDLRNVPGTEKFKIRLFNAAVQGLNRLSELAGSDRRDLAIARGYAKAGEGFMEVGQSGEAKAQFEESHEILERLAETEGETAEAIHHLRLGRSFRNIGRAEMGLSGPAKAIPWHQLGLASREKALPLHDDALFVKQEIAESYGDLGRAHLESGHAKEAADLLAHGAAYRDEWLTNAPHNDQANQEQAGLRRQIGLVKLGLGEIPAAVDHLRKAVMRLEPFALRETASSRDHLNLALFRSDLADALLMMEENEDAVDLYERSIGSIEIVREKNPDFVPAKKFHAGALYGLTAAESRLGKASAGAHIARSIELRRELVAGAASNSEFRRELMLALARGGEADEALKLAEAQLAEFPEDGGVIYQVACVYALVSLTVDPEMNAETAVDTLRQAVEKGHEGLVLMSLDPDLESLRDRADFKALLSSAKKTGSGDVAERG